LRRLGDERKFPSCASNFSIWRGSVIPVPNKYRPECH
jgi:hypothetical protein